MGFLRVLNECVDHLQRLLGHTDNQHEELKAIRRDLRRIKRQQDQILWCLKFPSPGLIVPIRTGERSNMQIQYNIQLPALPADSSDIDHGELTIVTNGGAPDVRTVAKDATSVDGLVGPLNAVVDLSFVYVDAAGNKSASPAVATVTLVDTFPPPNPGTIGITEVAEVADPAPAVDPATTDTPAATDPVPADPTPADSTPPADPATPPEATDPAAQTDAPPAQAGDAPTDTPASDAPAQ